MTALPSFITRPAVVLPASAPPEVVSHSTTQSLTAGPLIRAALLANLTRLLPVLVRPAFRSLTQSLDAGLPARVALSANLSLLLAVPLGQARRYLDDDPGAVVVDSGSAAAPITAPGPARPLDQPCPRLTLLEGTTLGDTVPAVPGVPMQLRVGDRAIVEVVLDTLRLTVGTLRSPGQYGSTITLHWRDLHPAGNTAPPAAIGDPTIPRLRSRIKLREFLR